MVDYLAMPEEIEVPTEQLQETIKELQEERAERAEREAKSRWTYYLALGTALLSVLAAIAAMEAGHLANEAVIHQIQAGDRWAYYNAKSIKGYLFETKADLLTDQRMAQAAKEKIKKYEREKVGIQEEATKLEAESAMELRRHERFAQVVTLLQIAIAVSAVAALARAPSIWYASLAIAAVGLALFVRAFSPGAHGPVPEQHPPIAAQTR